MYKENECQFTAGGANVAGEKECPESDSKFNVDFNDIWKGSVIPNISY